MKFKRWEIELIVLCIVSGCIALVIGRYLPAWPSIPWIIGLFTGLIMAYIKTENEDEKKD